MIRTVKGSKVTVRNKMDETLWTGLFTNEPTRAQVAGAIRDYARETREEADEQTRKAEAGDDFPPAGGCPGRGEIAGGLLLHGMAMEKLADNLQAGAHRITYSSVPLYRHDND